MGSGKSRSKAGGEPVGVSSVVFDKEKMLEDIGYEGTKNWGADLPVLFHSMVNDPALIHVFGVNAGLPLPSASF